MKTLLKESNLKSTQRWYPQSVSTYANSIILKGDYEQTYRFGRNFAYSMQYIEYLEKQIADLDISNVLAIMTFKSYIITAMGIVELLFTNLLKSSGNWNRTQWNETAVYISNPKKVNGIENKIETRIFEKVDEYDMRMDLDSMIKRIERKKLLSVEHDVFPVLKRLRELRNRVHLQSGENAYDHDFNNFKYETLDEMRKILYVLLTSKEFCRCKKTFLFLES